MIQSRYSISQRTRAACLPVFVALFVLGCTDQGASSACQYDENGARYDADTEYREGLKIWASAELSQTPSGEPMYRGDHQSYYQSAAKHFLNAANVGDPRGMLALVDSYLFGKGVRQDIATAAMWFFLARARGAEIAIFPTNFLSEAGEKGEQMAGDWKPCSFNPNWPEINELDVINRGKSRDSEHQVINDSDS